MAAWKHTGQMQSRERLTQRMKAKGITPELPNGSMNRSKALESTDSRKVTQEFCAYQLRYSLLKTPF